MLLIRSARTRVSAALVGIVALALLATASPLVADTPEARAVRIEVGAWGGAWHITDMHSVAVTRRGGADEKTQDFTLQPAQTYSLRIARGSGTIQIRVPLSEKEAITTDTPGAVEVVAGSPTVLKLRLGKLTIDSSTYGGSWILRGAGGRRPGAPRRTTMEVVRGVPLLFQPTARSLGFYMMLGSATDPNDTAPRAGYPEECPPFTIHESKVEGQEGPYIKLMVARVRVASGGCVAWRIMGINGEHLGMDHVQLVPGCSYRLQSGGTDALFHVPRNRPRQNRNFAELQLSCVAFALRDESSEQRGGCPTAMPQSDPTESP